MNKELKKDEESKKDEELKYAGVMEKTIGNQGKSDKYYYWVALGVTVLWLFLGMLTVNLLWVVERAPRTPLTLVLIVFIIIVLSVMAYLSVRLLYKRMAEQEHETKRWRTKLLDAYGCLLEAEVKTEKEEILKKLKNCEFEKNKEAKQNELELKKIEFALKEFELKLKQLDEE